ncbi:MAG: hypothetical protein EOO24_67170 [Comamonadaceae bacterium]|nr:MAG: hypothetical protein EOO24_67170 [Comamonadaceae bacterium]
MPQLNPSSARGEPHGPTYTAAFEELGLAWEWDPATYGPGREGLRAYLEKEHPHLLRAYEADFLLEAVEATRARLERMR